MGCNCKSKITVTSSTIVNDDTVGKILGSKAFYYFLFILTGPILIPLMLILGTRSIILGKPIDLLKVILFFIPKKKKIVANNE